MYQRTFRLNPGELLKEEIEKRTTDVSAGVLLSIVGGLEKVVLRMAGSEPDHQIVKEWNQSFEIVSGTGTLGKGGCHIHISVSDEDGNVIGGHLKDGCVVKYTAEIVVGIFEDISYVRRHDKRTGFKELEIE